MTCDIDVRSFRVGRQIHQVSRQLSINSPESKNQQPRPLRPLLLCSAAPQAKRAAEKIFQRGGFIEVQAEEVGVVFELAEGGGAGAVSG